MATGGAVEGSDVQAACKQADVIVVGAGMAGMSAALRLAERGLAVVLIEQDDFVGGKWGAHKDARRGPKDKPVYHEHCYHMFLNWFHNFWKIVDELGLRDEFTPHHTLTYLRRGEFPHTSEFRDVGSASTALHNVFSGVLPPADSFIYAYSLIDLLAEPIDTNRFRDRFSVNGFMNSRPYTTDAAAEHHQATLAKAFACPSYRTSAATYKRFIKYGFRHPEPMMWILKGDCEQHFHRHMRGRLEKLGVRFFLLHRLHYLSLDAGGRVDKLHVVEFDKSPTIHIDAVPVGKPRTIGVGEDVDVVLTLPPEALGRLINSHVYRHAPELANVRRLRSEPMASLDLYFRRKLEHIPRGHVVLFDSPHDVTFVDNSQFWPDQPNTVLNVVASNLDPLNFEDANTSPDMVSPGQPSDAKTQLGRNLAASRWSHLHTRELILRELREYLPFEHEDIDWDRSHIQLNTGEMLFVNETGTWQWRPETECGIPNLYIAGDYCKTPIDVVTVEAATVSGLMAAEAIRKRRGIDDPVQITTPDHHPEGGMAMMKLALAPYAYGAKMWAMAAGEARRLLDD